MQRDELVRYLDEYLRVKEIDDDSKNGLQVEGRPEVGHVALAVDACLAAFQGAVEAGADFLIVHHGMFWKTYKPLAGPHLRRVRALLAGEVSLYAVHLPLDVHPEVGNNATLACLLDLEVTGTFAEYHGMDVGVEARLAAPTTAPAFAERVRERLGVPVVLKPYGPEQVSRVGIVSGGADFVTEQAAARGLDLFLTGERTHTYFHEAEEHKIHVVYAGHYATETTGVQALGRHLADKFGLEISFLDQPTGL